MRDCEIWDTFAGCSRAFQKRTRLRFQFPGSLTPCSMDCDPARSQSPMGRSCHLPKGSSLCPGTAQRQSGAHSPPSAQLLCPRCRPVPFSRTTDLCVPSVSPVRRVARGCHGEAEVHSRAPAAHPKGRCHCQRGLAMQASQGTAASCCPSRGQSGDRTFPTALCPALAQVSSAEANAAGQRDCLGGATSRKLVPRSTRPCWHTQGLQQCLLWESCGSSCSSPRPPRAAALPFQSMARCAAAAGTTGPVENGALSSCVLF